MCLIYPAFAWNVIDSLSFDSLEQNAELSRETDVVFARGTAVASASIGTALIGGAIVAT